MKNKALKDKMRALPLGVERTKHSKEKTVHFARHRPPRAERIDDGR
jgi:hypothetical protein